MSVFDGIEYCDKCHLVIAPKDPGRLNYGKVHYHTPCYIAYRRNPRPSFITALLLALLVVISFNAPADEVYEQSEWKKGGVLVGRSLQGNCVWRPFIMVGHTNDHPDDGEPQILGYEPGNVQISRKGDVIFERVRDKVFAERNKPAKTTPCRCPNFNE